jgi:hypothetical protein
MNHILTIASWLRDTDSAALRARCKLEWLTRRVMLVLAQPDLDRDATLKWSAEYRALRQTQNTIGKRVGVERGVTQAIGERLPPNPDDPSGNNHREFASLCIGLLSRAGGGVGNPDERL